MRFRTILLTSALALPGLCSAQGMSVPGVPSPSGFNFEGVSYPPQSAVTPFVANQFGVDGDSQFANAGGLSSNGSTQSIVDGNSYAGPIQAALGNTILSPPGWNHAQGGSSSMHLTGGLATNTGTFGAVCSTVTNCVGATGNPAFAVTGIASDNPFAPLSDGVTNTLGAVPNVLFLQAGTNDSATAFNTTPTPIVTMQVLAHARDLATAAGKEVFEYTVAPRGYATTWEESHTVSAATATATLTPYVADGTDFGLPGVIDQAGTVYTKVGSGPLASQYAEVAGVYAFNAVSPPTTIYLTYASGAGNARGSILETIRDWEVSSSPSPFVDPCTGTSYAIPGYLNGQTHVHVIDLFAALLDPATDCTANGGNGLINALKFKLADGLHPTPATGITTATTAMAPVFTGVYPGLTTREMLPTENRVFLGTANGSIKTFSGTLNPGSIAALAPVPTQVCIQDVPNVAGVSIASYCDNGSGGFPTFPGTASVVYTGTGAITATFTTAPTTSHAIEAGDGTTTILDGMMDNNQGNGTVTPTGVTKGDGTTAAVVPKSWQLTVDANTQTALTSGAFKLKVETNLDPTAPCTIIHGGKTWPCIRLVGSGNPGSGILVTLTNNMTLAPGRINPANPDAIRGEMVVQMANGANGWFYGLGEASPKATLVSSTAVYRPVSNTSWTGAAASTFGQGGSGAGTQMIDQLVFGGGSSITRTAISPSISTAGGVSLDGTHTGTFTVSSGGESMNAAMFPNVMQSWTITIALADYRIRGD